VNGSEQPSDAVPVGCFHTTHWTEVLAAGAEHSPEATEALARLCQTYWLPIYAFIRKRGHGPHQAQDLTQEFFAGFLEKRRVEQAVRDRDCLWGSHFMMKRVAASFLACLLVRAGASAFPPAPHLTLFGLVRDQWAIP